MKKPGCASAAARRPSMTAAVTAAFYAFSNGTESPAADQLIGLGIRTKKPRVNRRGFYLKQCSELWGRPGSGAISKPCMVVRYDPIALGFHFAATVVGRKVSVVGNRQYVRIRSKH